MTHLFISPLITLHTDCPYRKKHSECLAYFVVQSCVANLFNVYVIGLLSDFHLLSRDCAQDPNG